MPHRPASRAPILAASLLAVASTVTTATADVILERSYLPTSTIVDVPMTSLLPTSYLVPTSYTSSYLGTSPIYATGDYLVPTSTSYVVPSYRSVRYRPRRYVERTSYYYGSTPTYPLATTSYLAPTSYIVPSRYISTSYLAPTSYLAETGLVTTSATICCDSGPAQVSSPTRTSASKPSPSAGGSTGTMITSIPSTGPSSERMPSGSVAPPGSADDEVSSKVEPPVRPIPAPTQATPPSPKPVDAGAPVGTKPGDEIDPNAIKIDPPGRTGADGPPGLPKLDQMSMREVRRPVYSEVRNILRGRVLSFDSGRPEESVTVILASKTGSFVDRTAMTDAFGEFKVSLPQGDWVVKVKMPSGSVLPVGIDSYLTASSGHITDPSGRDVPQFTIKR